MNKFYEDNLPLDYFTETKIKELDSNSPKISLFYSKNDINFIASHAEYLNKLGLQNMFFKKIDPDSYKNDIPVCPRFSTQHDTTFYSSNSFFQYMFNDFSSSVPRPTPTTTIRQF